MHDATELDPVAIRKALVAHRVKRTPWPEAWLDATKRMAHDTMGKGSAAHLLTFMEKHFRAAYFNTAAPEGRCMVPERDISHAVTTREPAPLVVLNHERCRSGDDCARPAVRGTFGRMWCEYHAAELDRLAVLFQRDTHFRDPRSGSGNRSIVGGRSRAA